MRCFAALVFAASLAVSISCSSRSSAATMMGHSGEIQPARAPAPRSSEPAGVLSISLPHDQAFAPPGPGREAFVTACVVCHSPRYITSQPQFSRAVWKGIVQKMIETYGAHITAPQAAEIVEYLVATNGANSIGEER
jgi:mono/diheme cytochrome c family protein